MDIKFENLAKIDLLIEKIDKLESIIQSEKRWLNIKETAYYLGYSTDRIHKLKGDEFVEGLHYYKRSGKLLFDKHIIDKWVLGIDQNDNTINIEEKVNNILDGLQSS